MTVELSQLIHAQGRGVGSGQDYADGHVSTSRRVFV